VTEVKRKNGYRRGYSVALLVDFEDDHAALWQVFSHVAKLHVTLKLGGKRADVKVLYNFYESVVDALRPMLKEGVKSIVVTAPMKTTYAADFLDHVQKHHNYLTQSKNPNRATFAELPGSADRPQRVVELVKTKEFHKIIAETTSEEADHTVNILEKYLYGIDSNCVVLFSLREIEDVVYNREKNNDFRTEYLMLTDKYLADTRTRIEFTGYCRFHKTEK
jgi:hypothetical protein